MTVNCEYYGGPSWLTPYIHGLAPPSWISDSLTVDLEQSFTTNFVWAYALNFLNIDLIECA